MNTSGFLFIPEHIMEREDLSLQEKIIYGRIIGLTKKEGYCFATNEWLGEQIGISGGRVSKHISSLVNKGILKVEVTKTKKKEGAPNEWGTKRKIYAFVNEATSPLVENDQPPLVENDQYSNIDNSIRESKNILSPFSQLNKEYFVEYAGKYQILWSSIKRSVKTYYGYCEEKKITPTKFRLEKWLENEHWRDEDYLGGTVWDIESFK